MSNFASKILKGVGAAALVLLLMAAGPGLYTGSVSIPATGTFTTASTINAAAGTNLTLNTLSAGGNVLAHYGDGAYAGFYAFDGGTTNYSELRGVGGLTFSSGGSYFGSTNSNVSGTLGVGGTGTFGGIVTAPSVTASSVTSPSGNLALQANGTTTLLLEAGSTQSLFYGPVAATDTVGAGAAYVAPVYDNAGNPLASTTHTDITGSSCNINAGTTCSATISLSSSSAFTSASSYAVVCGSSSVSIGGSFGTVTAQPVNGTTFSVTVLISPSGTGTAGFLCIATGS